MNNFYKAALQVIKNTWFHEGKKEARAMAEEYCRVFEGEPRNLMNEARKMPVSEDRK